MNKIKNKKQELKERNARRFVGRAKAGEEIPLRTLILWEKRMRKLHERIKSWRAKRKNDAAARQFDAAIDETLRMIQRAKVRRDTRLKIKKKVRTYGDSMVNRKKKK